MPLGGLLMTRLGLPDRHVTAGQMALAVDCDRPAEVSYVLHPRHGRDVWDPIMESGRLETADYGEGQAKVG